MVPDTVGLKATFMKIIYRKLCPNEEFYFFFLLQFHTDNANQVYSVQNHLLIQLLVSVEQTNLLCAGTLRHIVSNEIHSQSQIACRYLVLYIKK